MKYHIYINDTIGWPISAGYVSRKLADYKDQPVDVYVSSLGGDVNTALQIRQLFVEHGQVTCHLHGFVASAATILATGAKTVRMGKFAFFMIHKCSSWQNQWGQMNADDIAEAIRKLSTAKQALDQVDRVVGSIYAQRTGKPLADMVELMRKETWMTATEANNIGFADEIIDEAAAPAVTDELSARIVACGLPVPAVPAEAAVKPGDAAPSGQPSALERLAGRVAAIIGGKAKRMAEEALDEDSNQPQSQPIKTNSMKNLILTALCALLSVKEFACAEDGSVTLTEDQLRSIEDQLATNATALAGKQKEIDDLSADKKKLQAEVSDLQERIKNLEGGDGDDTTKVTPASGEPTMDDDLKAAAEAQAAFERMKGIL